MSEVITKQKILIADDSEMNRELLAAILEEEYDIIQVNDGVQAVDCLQRQAEEISLLLLDIVMPHMDGFEVLSYMNKEHWIDAIPVVIISSENSPIYIKRGYDLGATDFIGKPFDANMVLRRSANAILLGAKQRRMTSIVSNQIYEREKSSKLMINILSHIVEFRNGESGLHVLHIQTITEMLLRQLVQKENNRYALSKEQIRMITTASALHDIGKISIPDEILNKPGRLTDEEFKIGCMTSLRQLENHKGFNEYTNGCAKEALRHIVGVQFRNLATVGGSIYGRYGFSDVLTLLIGLDSYVELYKGGIVSIKEYAAQSYDRDIIVNIIVKKKPVKMFYEAVRITETDLPVLTCAGVGFSGSGEYNICIGARPGRAVVVEDKEGILKGGVNDETIESFARYVRENVSTESNMRGSAEYRSHLAQELTKRALRAVNY